MTQTEWIALGLFNVFVVLMLFVDLKWLHRENRPMRLGEALGWTAFWVGMAMAFCVGVWNFQGAEKGMQFLAGYILEESLSVDNLFVFLLVFSYFKVPAHAQHKVLFWGILGALFFRAIFIFAGVAIIHRFEWIMYIFGAFLIYSGTKLFFEQEKDVHPEHNPVVKIFRRIMPVTPDYEGENFFVRRAQRLWATPLFVVLLVIETTDIIFAVDSIPAVLSVSKDPFIIYTSNIFAILGLRSLFFALSSVMRLFHYLHYGLGAILVFVGIKMGISHFIHIPISVSLLIIGGILMFSVILSIIIGKKRHEI